MKQILLTVLIVFVLTGCPYKSEYSFGEIQPIDTALIGTWTGKQINFDDDEWAIDVTDFNDKEYFIDLKIKRISKTDNYRVRAYISRVEMCNILHFQYLLPPAEPRTFNYLKYHLDSDTLFVRFMETNDVTRQLKTKNDILDYIKQNLDNDDAWSKPIKFNK